jgi:queuine tRNA-ribosyltransferase
MPQQTEKLSFDVLDVDGAARCGVLRTPHGDVETPVFMPVGTLGAVKGLDVSAVRATGSRMLLGNTYHLSLRPGEQVVRGLGGLHAFMGWDGPILTDSGGYQLFRGRGRLPLAHRRPADPALA